MTVTRNTDGKHAKSTRFTLFADLVSYTSLFPYINQQVGELGIAENEDRVGYYSGVVEAVFAGVQFFTVYHWAKLSHHAWLDGRGHLERIVWILDKVLAADRHSESFRSLEW